MFKNLTELLFPIHTKPMEEQHQTLHQNLPVRHDDSPRIEDVVVRGTHLNFLGLLSYSVIFVKH